MGTQESPLMVTLDGAALWCSRSGQDATHGHMPDSRHMNGLVSYTIFGFALLYRLSILSIDSKKYRSIYSKMEGARMS